MNPNEISSNKSVMEVALISIKVLIKTFIHFWIFLPATLWQDSRKWLSENAAGSFLKNEKEGDIRVLPMLEGILHITIFLSWLIGAVITVISAIIAGSGWGGAGAFFTTLFTGLIITYFTPLAYALMREVVSILVRVSR